MKLIRNAQLFSSPLPTTLVHFNGETTSHEEFSTIYVDFSTVKLKVHTPPKILGVGLSPTLIFSGDITQEKLKNLKKFIKVDDNVDKLDEKLKSLSGSISEVSSQELVIEFENTKEIDLEKVLSIILNQD